MRVLISSFCVATILWALPLVSLLANANDKDKALDDSIKKRFEAIKNDDVSTIIDSEYTPYLDLKGGRSQISIPAMRRERLRSESIYLLFEAVPPYRRISTSANDYVVIPTHYLFSRGLAKYDGTDFELAIKPHGATKWEFMDGKLVSTFSIRDRLFPDLGSEIFPARIKILINSPNTRAASPASPPPSAAKSIPSTSTSTTPDEADRPIDADASRQLVAIMAKDAKVATDMMYTPIVNALGGRDYAMKMWQKSMDGMSAKGSRFVTYEAVPPFRKISTSLNDYAIIPLHAVAWIGLKEFEVKSFELGIKTHGEMKWQFVSENKLTPEIRNRFFPDLKDTVFPDVTMTLLFPTPKNSVPSPTSMDWWGRPDPVLEQLRQGVSGI